MSDAAITKDSLYHYDNRHIQVRWDFFELCAYDKNQFNCKLNGKGKIIKDEPNQECAAKILRILETLTNHEKLGWYMDAKKLTEQGLKPPPEPKEFPIQLSYGAICDLLYNTYGESTVRNTVAFLIHRNFIKQHQQTKNSIPFYVLRTDIVQKALKAQAEKSLSGVEINSQSGETFQVLKSTARRPKSTAKPLKSKDRSSEINSQTSEINSNNNSKNKTREKNERKPDVESPTPDSLTHSSTPSLSLVDNQPSSEQDDTPHHIANPTIENVESLTTRNTSSERNTEKLDPLGIYEPEEKQQHHWWCQLGRIGKINLTNKAHWQTLSQHVHSFQDMESLFKYTQANIRGKPNERVYPGNLVDCLDGWKQEREPEQPTKPKKQKITPEYLASLPL